MNNFDINKMMNGMSDENMAELFNKAKTMINEGKIPEEMKNMVASMQNGGSNNSGGSGSNGDMGIDMETMMKMKNIIEKMQNTGNDPRANLLMSLKPYLKETRKDKVDQYVKMLNMSKVMEMFNNPGGEKEK